MDNYNFYLQLIEEEKALCETLKALRVLIKRYEVSRPEFTVNSNKGDGLGMDNRSSTSDDTLGVKFEKGMTVAEKVLLTLSIIGSGTSREVGLKMREIDPHYTEDKAIDDARFYLSKLYKEGKVVVLASGAGKRGHVYSTMI